MNQELYLPSREVGGTPATLVGARQITLIGGNGSGKSKFMKEVMTLNEDRAYRLSALSAAFPERSPSTLKGSIDVQFEQAAKRNAYVSADAVSELDKLCYLLFIEEFEYLLSVKSDALLDGREIRLRPTKLDKLITLWQEIFPGNEILRGAGSWLFKTDAGEDTIGVSRLSEGERTVLYYIGAVMYAPRGAVIFIENPELFLHPAILNTVWNSIESLRPDCTFIYDTSDADFVGSRTENKCIWVQSYDAEHRSWDYQVLASGQMTDEMFVELVGTRKPVLFIEGDAEHSIDAKLYTLVFSDFVVRPLGSCNKVIESTRTFNDLKGMHHLESRGIVDRDRRTDQEVEYLRKKNIMVPEVAEIENIFLLEEVIRIMAARRGRNPDKVFHKVKNSVMQSFAALAERQALQHVRHKVKRDVECKIDAKFTCITALETHLKGLIYKLRPRDYYNELCRNFATLLDTDDYAGVLRVFNHKPVLGDCGVAEMLGYSNRDDYVKGVLSALKGNDKDSKALRAAVKYCFGLRLDDMPVATEEEGQKDMKTIAELIAESENRHTKKRKTTRRKGKTT